MSTYEFALRVGVGGGGRVRGYQPRAFHSPN